MPPAPRDPAVTRQVRRAATLSRGWHAALALVIAFGLVVQIILLVGGGADANSGQAGTTVALGTRFVRLFSYFTIQSNVIVLVVAVVLVVRPWCSGRLFRVLLIDVLLGIVITGLVFAIVLAPIVDLTGWAFVATVCFHYVSPVMALIGWLLFGPRPRASTGALVAAIVWPVAWLVWTFVHGAATHWWPYPFLDADELGVGVAVRNSGLVVLIGVVLAAVLVVADRRLRVPLAAGPPGSGTLGRCRAHGTSPRRPCGWRCWTTTRGSPWSSPTGPRSAVTSR